MKKEYWVEKERKMKLLEAIFLWLIIVYIASIPFIWMWVLYHKIKCRKAESCVNRQCKYWEWCSHNFREKTKDEAEMRRRNLMRKYGLPEDDME